MPPLFLHSVIGPITMVASLLVIAVFTACATKSVTPDTATQSKVRGDLEQCNVSAGGGKAHGLTVSPEGKYSFQIVGSTNANTMLDCMASKGYSGERVDSYSDHGIAQTRPSGGRGGPSR
jgi:hypothetical protein